MGRDMLAPVFILVFSLIGLAVAVALPGYENVGFLSVITGISAMLLILFELFRRLNAGRAASFRAFDDLEDLSKPVVVLDGSNIMHWKNGAPDLEPVRDVIGDLSTRGFRTGVVFDANVGYKLEGKYRHHEVLARKLGLSQDLVMVVNKGEPADFTILRVAQDFRARVVTNDRFRDWAEQFPQVMEPGFLISGGYRKGALQLDL